MPGKKGNYKKNYGAREAFVKRQRASRATDLVARTSQEMYRRACLKQRKTEGRLTEKNKLEIERLGN